MRIKSPWAPAARTAVGLACPHSVCRRELRIWRAGSRDSIQQAIPNGFPKMPRLGRQKVVSASPRTDALNSGSATIHRRPACGAGADQDDTGSDGVVDPDIRMALPDATLTREADDLDPVRVLSHRIFLELGKLAG